MQSDALREVFADAAQYFPTPLQQFQFFDKYSRFNYDLKRRETWTETVDRAVEYLCELAPAMSGWLRTEGRHMILTLQAMPSMRLLAMAGSAARRQNLCIYNCAYLPVDDIQAFVEMLIISMSGCGVGFSVEHQNVNKLPIVALQRVEHETPVHVIEDSTEGWAAALRLGLETWFSGGDVVFDFSLVRAAGAPLRTKDGSHRRPGSPRSTLRYAALV
jgi:ribonucleoside-diphosphate reductase alpha chain